MGLNHLRKTHCLFRTPKPATNTTHPMNESAMNTGTIYKNNHIQSAKRIDFLWISEAYCMRNRAQRRFVLAFTYIIVHFCTFLIIPSKILIAITLPRRSTV